MCISLDTKASNRDVDRLAREGDFDWAKLDSVINDLLIDGARQFLGPVAEDLLAPWLKAVREDYSQLLLDVPLDSVDRSQTLPALIEEFFAPHALRLLVQLQVHRPGPDLGKLLNDGLLPIATVFEWLEEKACDGSSDGKLEKFLYPGTTNDHKSLRDKMGKWRSGVDLPTGQSLKLLLKDIRAEPSIRDHADAAAAWLLAARALYYFDQLGATPVRPLLRARLESTLPDGSLRLRLQRLVDVGASDWPEMAELGSLIWRDLLRTSPKSLGDQFDTQQRIEALKELSSRLDPDGKTAYHLAWMEGRWFALSGRYEEALPHYKRAFQLAYYRAGHQLKDIVEDALCIASFLADKVFVKQLKQVGIVFGLFLRPAKSEVTEPWELEQFSQQLLVRFPSHGRFVGSEPDISESLSPGFMMISLSEVAAIQPDLRNPERVRAVQFSNGVVRRHPQLRLFASFGEATKVEALLSAGASVDSLDSSGASALLCALQSAHDRGERNVLDLLLRVRHQTPTVNARTERKQLTPLMCAIDLGEPDVVMRLLEMGGDADQLALTDQQSPLYYTVSKIAGRIYPNRMLDHLSFALLREPDSVGRDALRRFGVASAGVFGDDSSLMKAAPLIALGTAKAMVAEHVRRYSVEKLRQIVELLLRFGASPNRGHRYPTPGRTPLMLAAELDVPTVFELMVANRGDPLQPDAEGLNCFQIATAFRAHRVLSWLHRNSA
ncbi:ankyrin repeat domain-containing protein [Paucibacter sp. AS339]|uniref:ankyrin repeat domain-containing protein n=1 Tax=Paucibacter hankyongi TaxID=3133434 RepID=UPI0030A409DB